MHPGTVTVLVPDVIADQRGYCMETFRADAFRALGLPCEFLQDEQSWSRKGVARGLHFQWNPPMAKLDALDRASGERPESEHLTPTPKDIESFLKRVSAGESKQYQAVGEGEDIRLASPGLTGAALAAHGRVVHLSAFAT
jgi:dTDP-4-dehydrorhamnose 3,5-epimerase